MPELPEVQTVAAALAEQLIGRSIAAVDLRRCDIVTPADADFPRLVRGRRIVSLYRRGKRIVFALDNGHGFYIHLGMSGRLTLHRSGDAEGPPDRHIHLMLTLGELVLHFRDPRRFGGIFWLGTRAADQGLGPEPLTLPSAQLGSLLARTARPVKSALLDQRLIAGLGNIYVDESLHAAGIHPLTPAHRLGPEQIARLSRSIKSVLRRAIAHGGSTLRDYRTATGGTGEFQKIHRAYGREGQPCRQCGARIERIILGGRSTCFCPQCQPPNRPRRRSQN